MTTPSPELGASALGTASREAPGREPLLELYDALAQYQLRDAGAEVAAAIAHAVGTPLNVISGRAELIRHDPSNALAQVARIEEQVKKLANGLRQLVDYLALPDPRLPQRPPEVSRRTPADGTPPEARGAGPARPPTSPARPPTEATHEVPPEPVVVNARSVLADVVALTEPLARSSNLEVVADAEALSVGQVERWHATATLSALVSCALRHVAAQARKGANGHVARLRIGGSVAPQGVLFELLVPGLALVEGWQLEHFQARPAATESSEFYRTMSICGAVVRGHGGKLTIEPAANAEGSLIRFSCRNEAASS